jgi:Nif-specific regulatory protein
LARRRLSIVDVPVQVSFQTLLRNAPQDKAFGGRSLSPWDSIAIFPDSLAPAFLHGGRGPRVYFSEIVPVGPPIPKLVALSGPRAGETFPLEKDCTTLGRDAANDVVIDAQWVSRKHCEIRRSGDSCTVVDRGSHNGTAVNDVPVKERTLRRGDRITLGGASFLFVDSEPEPPAGPDVEDVAVTVRTTVQLRADDAVYLKPEGLSDATLGADESRKALAAILSLIRIASGGDERVPENVLDQFFGVVPAERGAILMGSSPEDLETIAARPRGRFGVSRTVLAKVFEEKSAVLSNDVATELSGKSLVGSKVSALVCLPLVVGRAVRGAVYLDRREAGVRFPEDRVELLMGLAGVAASALEKVRQMGKLRATNRRLREELELVHEMVGESPRLSEAQRILSRAAPTDTTVLIEGESGTGKELAARAVHFNSPRREGPLVKVDCTGLNENLLASELFGHERGAFTGAIQQKKGKIELANEGTVFLDEVGELPLALQAQLLRVLQDREFERVGGTRPIPVDIRLVAATNRDLAAEVKKGNFREDLYYRLNVVKVLLPPLRERRDDVELLVQFYISEHARKVKRPVAGISPEALGILKRYEWPGNVRELANCIERAVVLGTTELILPEDLPESMLETRGASGSSDFAPSSYHEAVAERKKELILDAVARASGSITDAAKLLGLHPNYLHRLIRNLELRDRLNDG